MSKTNEISRPLPELATVCVAMNEARQRLEEMARRYDRESMSDRVWLGVCCLAAQERHALAVGRPSKKLSQRDNKSEIDPNAPHEQGFAGWLGVAAPWLPRPTAYKYMDAARGCGLDHHATEAETRAQVARLLEQSEGLTLGALVEEGRKALPGGPAALPPAAKPTPQQLTFESILGFGANAEQVIASRPHMTPRMLRAAMAHAYRTLRELSGTPWGPADEDDADLAAALAEIQKGGL